jgi:hypothetical protein
MVQAAGRKNKVPPFTGVLLHNGVFHTDTTAFLETKV